MSPAKRKAFLALWVLAAVGGTAAWWKSGIPITQLPAALRDFVEEAGPWGPAVYVGLFVLRALTFAPATPFVLAAGLVWGPLKGLFWAWTGINLSGWAAYWVAALVGRSWVASHETPWMADVEHRLKKAPFTTTIVLRMVFLPFDATNYACGLVGIPFLPYVGGTAIGTLPGAATFALFGGAWSDPRALALSGGVLALSLLAAKLLRRAESAPK